MMLKQKKFIIIDGNALLHRAYHALPPMTLKDGTLVNAVYGFTSILLKIIKELKPDYLCAAFDRQGKTLRAEAFAGYKAQRVKQPDELYQQIPIIEKILDAFNIPVIDAQTTGYEADDVIGTVVVALKNKGIKSIIVTGDLDALQLVDDQTEVFTLKKGINETVTYGPETVQERYGLKPKQLIDYKALRGDPSDNIPGVKGIGEKTAAQLIQTFGTLDRLYRAIEKNDPKLSKFSARIISLITEGRTAADLSQKLVTIKTDLPTNFKLDDTVVAGFNAEKIVKLFSHLEFKSLLNKIPVELNGRPGAAATEVRQSQMEFGPRRPAPDENSGYVKIKTKPKDQSLDYQLIDDEKAFERFFTELKKQKLFAVDSETTSLDVWRAELLGLSFAWRADEAYYLNISGHKQWLKALQPLLENPHLKKIGHHLKYDLEILLNHGVELKGIAFDTLLAAYLLTSSNRNLSLDSLVFGELGHQMQPIEDLIGQKGKGQLSLGQVQLQDLAWYSAEDADFSLKLANKLQDQLKKIADLGLLQKIELPLIPVLATMEQSGIKIDKAFLKKLDRRLTQRLKTIEQKVYKLAKKKFNLASPRQLKEILFDQLHISSQGLKKIKTGISTAAGELEKMMDRHPIIGLISEFREYSKLQNTYTRSLPKLADQDDRIHTTFNQTITATGRLSSSEPNLQNIPIRTALGREIRKAFIPKSGYKLIAADYSQIELRVIASLAQDEKMIRYFQKGEDIHSRTAANVNKIKIDQVTKEQRRAAKEVNFGVIYGLGSTGLAQRTGLSKAEAKEFIAKYFALHPQIKNWLEATKKLAVQQGYVETLLGRRRYLPDIHSGVPMIRAAAERMAVNAPIQGTAADLLKMAMIKIHEGLPKISPRTKMLLTVHDELVFEAPNQEVSRLSAFIKKTMENIYPLRVPVIVEVKAGKNWGECK
ncbi:MAG: polymerase I protein [Parcubacteria group bacterium GW2011_GWA2_43_17]|nr:MAG: polymerase I protein [Parcubacteria group bacterium GW2011_GWA2_43_17]OGY92830.1 MAG: DNA polymerase I [Candidatus Komeilibacteria bacterium RIFOXYA2_FULL_45_9]OGY94795.1 MAG: DNA polymerase I [Candidatus Komeilibacteria bacterium RIFOXYC2_FULL_45_12]HAH04642.1 DNA polymerase I [Candidatus Komeilibacteria bacterium]HBR13088.1 DNA polymerase I [Candidatus Komeilibacteria bacterium]